MKINIKIKKDLKNTVPISGALCVVIRNTDELVEYFDIAGKLGYFWNAGRGCYDVVYPSKPRFPITYLMYPYLSNHQVFWTSGDDAERPIKDRLFNNLENFKEFLIGRGFITKEDSEKG